MAKLDREVVVVGWDGASQPMYRYRDELGLPDSQRSHVPSEDRPTMHGLRRRRPDPPSIGLRVEFNFPLRDPEAVAAQIAREVADAFDNGKLPRAFPAEGTDADVAHAIKIEAWPTREG